MADEAVSVAVGLRRGFESDLGLIAPTPVKG